MISRALLALIEAVNMAWPDCIRPISFISGAANLGRAHFHSFSMKKRDAENRSGVAYEQKRVQ